MNRLAAGGAESAGPARMRSRDLIESIPPAPDPLRPESSRPLRGVDVMLAPLCGITDSVFRKICLDHGADLVVTEMISSEGLVRNSDNIRAIRQLDMRTGPLSLQIFGADPDTMGEAARILSALRPRYIDMNFGCPVRKIISKNGGSAVLKDLNLLGRICRHVVKKSSVPVSAKIRTGWDKPTAEHLRELGRVIEDAGVSTIVVHARTKKQGFTGKANWALIAAIKDAVSIPVVGNGDVSGADEFFKMKEVTGCDAVMIGRHAIGNPWIFEEIKAAINGRAYSPPTSGERVRVLLDHVRLAVEKLGEPTGLVVTRKIMSAYLKRLHDVRELRARIVRCERLTELEHLLSDYLEGQAGMRGHATVDAPSLESVGRHIG
jgi:nifR3 family TIM-barrel protein